jgi:hypothetical protein
MYSTHVLFSTSSRLQKQVILVFRKSNIIENNWLISTCSSKWMETPNFSWYPMRGMELQAIYPLTQLHDVGPLAWYLVWKLQIKALQPIRLNYSCVFLQFSTFQSLITDRNIYTIWTYFRTCESNTVTYLSGATIYAGIKMAYTGMHLCCIFASAINLDCQIFIVDLMLIDEVWNIRDRWLLKHVTYIATCACVG